MSCRCVCDVAPFSCRSLSESRHLALIATFSNRLPRPWVFLKCAPALCVEYGKGKENARITPRKTNQPFLPRTSISLQGSLLGSILSNLLLVLGMCFFFGGLKNRPEQSFNMVGASTFSSLLLLSCIGLCVPAVFHQVLPEEEQHLVRPLSCI